MAIQFNCPYCTAMIRVPDSAAGKQGACPKCATKLIVPKVGPAAAQKPKPPDYSPPPDGPPPALDLPDEPDTADAPSMARVARRRGRSKSSNLIFPIALFCVVMGVLAYFLLQPAPKMEGELTAEFLPDFKIPPASIDNDSLNLTDAQAASTMDEMKRFPPNAVRISDWFEMEFRPSDQGLQVVMEGKVFRVPTSKYPEIEKFIEKHADEITKQRNSEYRKAAKRFVADWKSFRDQEVPFNTTEYREPLGCNRLTKIMGYTLAAKIGPRFYRCVHETNNGDLYFLLPKATKSFLLVGREMPNGKPLFPGRYKVTVSNLQTDEQSNKSSEAEEPEMPSPMDQSMNPTPDAS